jgi:hypothetical protein
MALMNAILGRDLENGIPALSLYVRAANDAYMKPHQGRFEPDVVRKKSIRIPQPRSRTAL